MSVAAPFASAGFDPVLAAFLAALLDEVRHHLRQFAADPNRSSGSNAKGDIQRAFDLETDRLVRRRLAEFFPAGILTTEEGADERIGSGPPQVRLVVDPVDGSDNWRLGLAYSALCISAFPPDGPLDLTRQQWAFVGDLAADQPAIYASRGGGAWREGMRLRTSRATKLAEATISVQLSHSPPIGSLLALFAAAKSIRSYGSSSHDIGLVARGALDAHVDTRGRLTPESFLAACLAVEEAGGCIVGHDGRPLPPYDCLTDRASLIVAATRDLAEEILAVLSPGKPRIC